MKNPFLIFYDKLVVFTKLHGILDKIVIFFTTTYKFDGFEFTMKEIEKITLFYEISNALNEHLDLEKSLYQMLNLLSDYMGMVRGTVSILDPLRDEINIVVAHGLSKSAIQKGKYKLGEGITGKVIQTGKAVTIPKISEEPEFLDRETEIGSEYEGIEARRA